MKKLLSMLLVLCMMMGLAGALAETAEQAPEEALSVTHHTAEIAGQTLSYTATAGRLPVEVDGNRCNMFFTAYTLDGVEDLAERPVTFAFNGGPGTASLYVHLGMMGPRRVDVDDEGTPNSLPTRVVDNPCSILDMTDLVFIDPVGTGYSRAAEGTDPSVFWNYDGDVASVSAFIRLYASRNGRWGSPKYVAGESYGTIRAVGVADYLAQNYTMPVNGVMLISSCNNAGIVPEKKSDAVEMTYTLCLPTYAAIAWYHGLLDEKYQSMTLEDYLAEVREFAGGDYQAALFKGVRLTDAEKDDIAGRLAAYTGFGKEEVLRLNLRIFTDDFCTGLLSDRKLSVGRIDGRMTGPVTQGSIGDGDADPSMGIIETAFGNTANSYLGGELDYHTDLIYRCSGEAPYRAWKYNVDNRTLDQKEIIYNLMSRNRFLKIWVLCGYYDLATPFFAAEWVYDHVFLNPESRENLRFTYYPSGHMIYMHHPSLEKFRNDAEEWYK